LTFASRLGGWLFRQRTWLPLPLVAALLAFPPPLDAPGASLWIVGALIVAIGEAIRLWAVHHIGAISRTRSDRLGPLVSSGPFALIRNPLYVGNILLWTGFAVSAQLLWLAPVIAVLLALEYHAIVRWEEGLLVRESASPRVIRCESTRWPPSLSSAAAGRPVRPHSVARRVQRARDFDRDRRGFACGGCLV
jgi:hypothetical protein